MAAEQRDIDWGSADVEDATLMVELTGASSKAWKQRFETVLALLETPHSHWREVRLTKRGIEVARVQQGAETELRHFLESVVLQVNSELPEPQEAPGGEEEAGSEDLARADRQMEATFRAFADE